MQTSLYPWQEAQWQQFLQRMQADTLAHAILLTGVRGIGKLHFAQALVASNFCLQLDPAGFACKQCKNCHLFAADTYPDFIFLQPSEESNTIAVDEIRGLIGKLALTRHFDRKKIALIQHADRINANAANALLKTLEEPPAETILILMTDKPQALPATIRSRCQQTSLNLPDETEALAWLQSQNGTTRWESLLKLAQGAPLAALDLLQSDLVEQRHLVVASSLKLFEGQATVALLSSELESIPVPQILAWLQCVVADLMRIKAMDNPPSLENPDFYRHLLALAPRMTVSSLQQLWEFLLQRSRIFDASLNRRLFIEDVLIQCRTCNKSAH